MKSPTILMLCMLVAACASRGLRCDGKLTAINAPGGDAVTPVAVTRRRP